MAKPHLILSIFSPYFYRFMILSTHPVRPDPPRRSATAAPTPVCSAAWARRCGDASGGCVWPTRTSTGIPSSRTSSCGRRGCCVRCGGQMRGRGQGAKHQPPANSECLQSSFIFERDTKSNFWSSVRDIITMFSKTISTLYVAPIILSRPLRSWRSSCGTGSCRCCSAVTSTRCPIRPSMICSRPIGV